ncbi:MAG: DeoR/GlpR family DNA-binding transcription regulator [Liquorilactobacillus nagelii]|uniref:DeoR/GlpR family DNA-binding transcription regulator n=1 Tax=Liquorilactobacillus nagelii TaxID=82688 RepID=UPI00070A5160|nr:DeoR/GlpR family DNA-binding transcription regulator [Liquorilactobacillus nagelii]MCI1922426.1 DeoR/GlpR family DNA-binding transcription regulator [Liquorilactobacillus nagelii]MCI1978072.1 DeoR/GlpR family DNA-binding transcription regulator [Liquorilactobacillus nagelii]QYH53215.1 DeoR/GlpR transcriptional regulator [Liquorilactobacillus nagelii DSM 13675]QYH55360.1 DeoR/GlpR transcriptional regulator [Liquorilactobacillus nagelii DSM 13675]
MLKRERLMTILEVVNEKGIVTVNDLIDQVNVSDMTIRRDLDELAQSGKLIRIHGGAQSIESEASAELSHIEKKEIHITEKIAIAQKAATLLRNNDTVFIGPGTTLELMCKYIEDVQDLRVVTNSLPIFETLKDNHSIELTLIGGTYRERSGAFIGGLTSSTLAQFKFNRAFIGVNGIHNDSIMTASMEEGSSQTIALNNATQKIVVADYHKLNKDDFYKFYDLYDIDCLITNKEAGEEKLKHYQQYTEVIVSD